MKFNINWLLICVVFVLISSCTSEKDKAIKDFGRQYLEAQHDYCSTNIFIAEEGLKRFLAWLSDPNHATEPAMSRDQVLYQINGRLFLIEEYLGDAKQANRFYEQSIAAYNRYNQYVQSLHLPGPQHPSEPITSKEELKSFLSRQEKGLEVGWKK